MTAEELWLQTFGPDKILGLEHAEHVQGMFRASSSVPSTAMQGWVSCVSAALTMSPKR